MAAAESARKVIVVIYLIVLHGVVVYFALDKYVLGPMIQNDWTSGGAVPAPSIPPFVTPTTLPSLTPSPAPYTAAPSTAVIAPGRLIIPVVGVRPDQLVDTFSQARSDERVHEAIDIVAPQMTAVVAVADGEIVKFHDSELGGITIYQISTDKRYFYYYAHLHSRAAGITEGQPVAQGTVIGYVGDTGNAGAGNFHLHFSINAVKDTKRFWDGVSINPYPVLRGEQSLP